MRRNYVLIGITFGVVTLLESLTLATVFADGDELHPSARFERTTPTTRQYSDRLPPVMPGEEIETETGQRMRVWSSSGPVPINRQPTPASIENNVGNSRVGVIVDSRSRQER